MIRGVLRLSRALFPSTGDRKLSGSQPPTGGRSRMTRNIICGFGIVVCLAGIATGLYSKFLYMTAAPAAPIFDDNPQKPLAPPNEFEKLAREDPVALLAQCLSRYTREVRGGVRFTLQKQERVKGEPAHPEMPTVEVIDVCVRGDLPDPETKRTDIEVIMKWKSGAKKFLGAEIAGTLFSEVGYDGKVVTWRPKALFSALSNPVAPNTDLAKGQSRYCIRDAGLYRSMLRTHEAWKTRQAAGELRFEYLGKRTPEQIGRECHVIKRICPRVEIDAFEIGGTASTDPKVVATEGFIEVTIFIDAERWLQVGTELYRTEPDGTRVLVGAYYFRDVQLNPSFPPDTFTATGLKK
jgi:hypothetical protein